MGEKLTSYDPAEDLQSDEAIAVFMEEAFKTEDAAYIAHALGVVAEELVEEGAHPGNLFRRPAGAPGVPGDSQEHVRDAGVVEVAVVDHADFPEDLPLTMDQHVQQAVDCWNAGATVLHMHVRELNGKGSKRMSQFNELLARLRQAVPDMILQVGGSISFAPEGAGGDAKWLGDEARHMLAELDPKPDQVTIAINTSQMNIVELMTDSDIEGTSFQRPELYETYRNMEVPASPAWVEEHLRRLVANGIQPHFQLAHSAQLETVERLVRRGIYTGPLNITWVAIGGGFDGPNPYTMMEFIRRVPDGASLTLESIMRNVLPINAMAIALGLHTRCGNEDTLWRVPGEKITSVQAIEQLVRIAKELGREVATGKEAREIYKLDEHWGSTDEALAKLGYPPNRRPGQVGFLHHA